METRRIIERHRSVLSSIDRCRSDMAREASELGRMLDEVTKLLERLYRFPSARRLGKPISGNRDLITTEPPGLFEQTPMLLDLLDR